MLDNNQYGPEGNRDKIVVSVRFKYHWAKLDELLGFGSFAGPLLVLKYKFWYAATAFQAVGAQSDNHYKDYKMQPTVILDGFRIALIKIARVQDPRYLVSI